MKSGQHLPGNAPPGQQGIVRRLPVVFVTVPRYDNLDAQLRVVRVHEALPMQAFTYQRRGIYIKHKLSVIAGIAQRQIQGLVAWKHSMTCDAGRVRAIIVSRGIVAGSRYHRAG